jgi:hypothetical protein
MGSNCFGKCPNNLDKWKNDEKGSHCYGKCANNVDVWKVDTSGSNCYGLCENNPSKYKSDPTGSNCISSSNNDSIPEEKEDDDWVSSYSECTSFAPYADANLIFL